MLRELPREDEAQGRLNLPRRHRLLLRHLHEFCGFSGNLLERVRHERVHDAHGLLRKADLRVNLLQGAVDVGVERRALRPMLRRILLAT